MQSIGPSISSYGLENHGIRNVNLVHWNLSTPLLYEEAIRRREGRVAHLGPLVVRTGSHTNRAANDKLIVRDASAIDKVWWGKVNRPMDPHHFSNLFPRLLAYLQGKDLFVQDCFAGHDPVYRLPLRIITETAWHSLFARNLFIQAPAEQLQKHVPAFTLIHTPNFHAVPELDGTRSDIFIVIHFGQKIALVGGTQYAGEIKKSIFTVLNFLLPQKNVLSLHGSANMGREGDVAVFLGLSGTGKTTLSFDPDRQLIGDDEHGWSDRGVFNLEGGCYAKVIRLDPQAEPDIYESTRRFGTILENVTYDSMTGRLNLEDDSLTENTRAAFPISHIAQSIKEGFGDHPRHIFMLTADAFGILPPIALLNPQQAIYHFLSGYAARVSGKDKAARPQATFSACFGAPFMALSPRVYANLLGDRIARHKVKVWLLNTGWTGGPYGIGQRIPLALTRAMVRAALNGQLDSVPMQEDPLFRFQVSTTCPEVPAEILLPKGTWADAAAYDAQARKLAILFTENFKFHEDKVSPEIRNSNPVVR